MHRLSNINIFLEKLKREDFPRIKEWIDPNIFHIFKAPVDEHQLERLLSKEQDGIPTEIGMRAVEGETNEVVGLIHSIINAKDNYTHIQQIVVDPAKRGKGIGVAILTLFVDLCFNDYNLHRVQLFADENNLQAISCYKKVGFKIDGLMRDLVKTDTGYMSTYVFSILHDEWLKKESKA